MTTATKRGMTVHTHEGCVTDTIEIQFGDSPQISWKNEPSSWNMVHIYCMTHGGVVSRNLWSGDVEVTPWLESPIYHHRKAQLDKVWREVCEKLEKLS